MTPSTTPSATVSPSTEAVYDPSAGHPRRWAALAVACLAVFVTVLDGTIVNVAGPAGGGAGGAPPPPPRDARPAGPPGAGPGDD
jgi:hypothetical protein